MAKTIVVTSGKGGAGKTAVTANIGVCLAKRGQRVALVDAQIGLCDLDVALGLENRVVFNWLDVLEGNCSLEQALLHDRSHGELYLAAGAQLRDDAALAPDGLQGLVAALEQRVDFVLIDCPAGVGAGFQNAVACAKETILVVQLETAALRDADRVVGRLLETGNTDTRLLINRYRPAFAGQRETNENAWDIEDAAQALDLPLLGVVPEQEGLALQANAGQTALAAGEAAKAYENIAARLLGEQTPLMDFAPAKAGAPGLLGSIKRAFTQRKG